VTALSLDKWYISILTENIRENLISLSDEFCRYSSYDRIGLYISCDDRSCCDYRSLTYRDPREDDRVRTEPYSISYRHRSSLDTKSWILWIMLERIYRDISTKIYIFTYPDTLASIYEKIIPKNRIIPYLYAKRIKEYSTAIYRCSSPHIHTIDIPVEDIAYYLRWDM
jgi:hypothetical protein